jgi:hypothetical protein
MISSMQIRPKFESRIAQLKYVQPLREVFPSHGYFQTDLDGQYPFASGVRDTMTMRRGGSWVKIAPTYTELGRRDRAWPDHPPDSKMVHRQSLSPSSRIACTTMRERTKGRPLCGGVGRVKQTQRRPPSFFSIACIDRAMVKSEYCAKLGSSFSIGCGR